MDGRPVDVSEPITANAGLLALAPSIQSGALLGDVSKVVLCNPTSFNAGFLHEHGEHWQTLITSLGNPCPFEVLQLIGHEVSIFYFFQSYQGLFKGESYNSE